MPARLSALALGVLVLLLAPALAHAADGPKVALVYAPGEKPVNVIEEAGLDLIDHRPRDAAGRVAVIINGPADEAALVQTGLSYTYEQPAPDRASRRADRDPAPPALPSGRTGYRTLDDYNADMDALVAAHPDSVRPITLQERTLEGREVRGVEIAKDVSAQDGRPTMLIMGLHHAREWPSGEATMEWAIDLAGSLANADPRVTDLLSRARVIAVPVVNPDGFVLSRGGGPFEYKRKNCRVTDGATPTAGQCADPANVRLGTDPNRNYGGLWGAPGASFDVTSDAYRGVGPFSEPESRNIRSLMSARTITVAISNHTYSDLMLRPPGQVNSPAPPDNALLKQLGDAMGAVSNLTSQPAYALYDTSGGMEDWSYWSAGVLSYTPEIGAEVPGNSLAGFHPDYATWAARYPGLREAYLIGLDKAADPTAHSVVAGRAPAGAQIELTRSFTTSTSPIIQASGPPLAPQTFPDTLTSSLTVPASGTFTIDTNPSTSPIMNTSRRGPEGPTTAPVSYTAPGTTTSFQYVESQAADAPASAVEEIPFTIAPGDDDASAQVRLAAATVDDDFDLFVYRVGAGGARTLLGESANGGTDVETVQLQGARDTGALPAGDYVAKVVDYESTNKVFTLSVTFAPPVAVPPGPATSWTLRCRIGGAVVSEQSVFVQRGERVDLANACPTPAPASATPAPIEPTPASQEPAPPAAAMPTLALQAKAGTPRLARALRDGLAVTVTCAPACRPSAALQREGNTVATAGRPGRHTETTLRLRFTRAARRALANRRSVTLHLVVVGVAADGTRATDRIALTLQR